MKANTKQNLTDAVNWNYANAEESDSPEVVLNKIIEHTNLTRDCVIKFLIKNGYYHKDCK